jgi:hypothetical protein
MKVRFRITCVACLVFALGGAPQLRAQFDLYIAHVADGAGFFSQISVNNPNGNSDVTCTFSTFDGHGNPLNLVYASDPRAAAAFRRTHAGTKPAATAPQSSVAIDVPAGGTTQVETSGDGDGMGNVLQGGAELNCSGFVIGGVTYWYTIGGDLVTGIGVPATDTTTAFRVDGGNEHTAFAFYNPSQVNTLQVSVQAYDGATGNLVDQVLFMILPNGHYAFNATDALRALPSPFFGSFRVPPNGQQFVPLALGVANTSANAAGYVLFTTPSLSGTIEGIDQ